MSRTPLLFLPGGIEITSVSETPDALLVGHIENLPQLSGDSTASCRLRGKHAAVL